MWFYYILAFVMFIWTIFSSVYTATYLVHKMAVTTNEDRGHSPFYVPWWENWTINELVSWLFVRYWRYWITSLISALTTLLLIWGAA